MVQLRCRPQGRHRLLPLVEQHHPGNYRLQDLHAVQPPVEEQEQAACLQPAAHSQFHHAAQAVEALPYVGRFQAGVHPGRGWSR
jgi:hypothetical protein